ncbi:hypothetical protein, partial [Streptomyces sp. NPDC005538]|uniref:hypothetical protein n=1 Tax=Streptomyces sp. NPDC005538 TaxID=3157043 RepID=UPI0033A91097
WGSGRIDIEDALTLEEAEAAFNAGVAVADVKGSLPSIIMRSKNEREANPRRSARAHITSALCCSQ